MRRLLTLGAALLVGFVAIRWLNVYGDAPWFVASDALTTLTSFLSLTKYPPSLLFLLATLGPGRFCWRCSMRPRTGESPRRFFDLRGGPDVLLRPPSVRAEGRLPRRLCSVRAKSGRVT